MKGMKHTLNVKINITQHVPKKKKKKRMLRINALRATLVGFKLTEISSKDASFLLFNKGYAFAE